MTAASAVVTSTTPLWYATRATGLVSLVLLTGSVLLGILVSVRFATERWPRFVTIGVHRNISLLVTVFLFLHVATAVFDSYAPVGWFSLVVPFVSAYRPLWLGLGTVASDVLVALVITSLLRTRIGHRTWRVVHWAAYLCWPLAVVHGLGTGSDTRTPVILGITIVCALCVLAAAAWRLASGWPAYTGVRVATGVTGAAAVVVVALWSLGGPLKPGWAARAGTPANLVALAAGSSATPTGTGASSGLPALPLSTAVTGTISTANTNSGLTTVTIDGTGTSPVAFHVVISGPAAAGGGVQMSTSQVAFGPTTQPGKYSGRITGLNGTDIHATVTDSAGSTVSLTLNLSINGPNVSGTLAATAGAAR